MKINEASKFFKNLVTETDEKSEIRVYKKFIAILSQLDNRDLSDEQLQAIEDRLDVLAVDVDRDNRKKYFKQKLTEFSSYLKKELSLISEEYFIAMGMSVGMCLGMSLGMTFGIIYGGSNGLVYGMTFGMMIGMSIGLAIGASMDTKAKKEGKVLVTKSI
ncbi:hypothetical protein [Aquimarina sp. 2201CG14-23]|uniref:hypothetical protein n=1 Tax=Aquimarina mycalae TaxID=3040073 RepID=UPI002477D747|nr:hypothetical protein [Aquimarina sp. 2201CG14-23]MDH7444426.1 hypothetical protein [Aquimarina sp. 2201CG14-23]